MTPLQSTIRLAEFALSAATNEAERLTILDHAASALAPLCPERAEAARQAADAIRHADAQQLKFREVLRATAAPAETRLTPDDVAGMFRAAALPVEIEGMWENYLTSCGDANSEAIPRAVFDDVVLAWMEAGGTREELRQRIEQAEHEHFATAAS